VEASKTVPHLIRKIRHRDTITNEVKIDRLYRDKKGKKRWGEGGLVLNTQF